MSSDLISLGLGSPADIPTFLLVGLSTDAAAGEAEGALTVTLGALTSTAAGTVAMTGAVSQTLGALTADAQGVIGEAPREGALTATLGALSITSAGTVAIAGALSVTLGTLTSVSVVTPRMRLVGVYEAIPVRLVGVLD